MTLSPPFDLTKALFGKLAAELEKEYPGWKLDGVNATGLNMTHPPRWMVMSEAELEAWREAEIQKWRDNGWCRGERA